MSVKHAQVDQKRFISSYNITTFFLCFRDCILHISHDNKLLTISVFDEFFNNGNIIFFPSNFCFLIQRRPFKLISALCSVSLLTLHHLLSSPPLLLLRGCSRAVVNLFQNFLSLLLSYPCTRLLTFPHLIHLHLCL